MTRRPATEMPVIANGLAWLLSIALFSSVGQAQIPRRSTVNFQVSGASQNLEMTVNTSRILTLEHNVPRLLVNNPEIIRATPLSPNEIQVSARRPGVTELNVWDENDNVHTIDIQVFGDSRELESLLRRHFPSASVQITPTQGGAIISGHVPQAEMVSPIVELSQQYYGSVINHMTVSGAQQVALHVKVVEVSRTKLRQLGVDWAVLMGDDFIIQSASGLATAAATQAGTLTGAGDTIRFGILNGGNSFGAYIDALRQNNLAKLLAEPTLITISGRPASFNVGGEVPIPVPAGLGVTAIEFREFGTQVDFVPRVLGNGNIHLEIRPQITEVDASLTVNGTPGFRSRRVDTGVEMKAGQTLVLAGLVFTRVDSSNRGIPWLSDLPWVGSAFRRVEERVNEVELLILVRPEFVEALDPHEVPACGPGQSTTSPNDVELYYRGYLEVPGCCNDGSCPRCISHDSLEHVPAPVIDSVSPMEIQSQDLQPLPAGLPNNRAAPDSSAFDPSVGELNRNGGSVSQQPHNGTSYPTTTTRGSAVTTVVQQHRSNRNSRSNPFAADINTAPLADTSEPSLIGPIGYDVLK